MEPPYDWIPRHLETFSKLKKVFSKSVLLHHTSADTTLSLTAHASETAIGAAPMRYLVRTKINHYHFSVNN